MRVIRFNIVSRSKVEAVLSLRGPRFQGNRSGHDKLVCSSGHRDAGRCRGVGVRWVQYFSTMSAVAGYVGRRRPRSLALAPDINCRLAFSFEW
jgi:hypothetical protein